MDTMKKNTKKSMDLDAQSQAVIDELTAFGAPPITEVTPGIARELPTPTDAVMAVISKNAGKRAMDPAMPVPEPVAKVDHILIPRQGGQILARVYTPEGDGPFPVLVYYHGGGWVIANLNVYDGSCRALCNAAECVVVSVAYRQAPENPFPAPLEDGYTAFQWVAANAAQLNGDPNRVAIGGESAGGNMATVVSLLSRDRGGAMPVHQMLVYPVTNYAFDTPSYQESEEYKPLSSGMMAWFWKHYLANEADGSKSEASPLQAQDLSGLPSATLITAEFDPLRDEGEAYAVRLREAGVPVNTKRYDGVPHEFFGMGAVVDKAKDAVKFAADDLRRSFESQPMRGMNTQAQPQQWTS